MKAPYLIWHCVNCGYVGPDTLAEFCTHDDCCPMCRPCFDLPAVIIVLDEGSLENNGA